MPVYDIAALSEALNADSRLLDNLLSRNDIEGVERRARGVTRRVTLEAAVTIRIALDLANALKIPFARALSVGTALAAENGMEFPVGAFGLLRFDVPAIRRFTLQQLDAAVETVGRRRRGRPPKLPLTG